MKIKTKLSMLSVGLLGAVVVTIALLVIQFQRRALEDQSKRRLGALMEGVARVGHESVAAKDRLMLVSYLMFLQKAHPELAYAAVTRKGHTARVGEDGDGLLYLDREVSSPGAPVKYTVTAYPGSGAGPGGDLEVSRDGVSLKVGGDVKVKVEEPEDPERLLIRLGFLKESIDREVSEALAPLMRRTAGIAAVLMALGALANLYFGSLLVKPIEVLAAATAMVGRGRMDVSVPVKSRDEVGMLSAGFNAMTGRLRDLMRLREDMLHSLTHEMNTPLNGIKAYVELWQDRGLPESPEDRRRVLATMSAAVKRMEGSLSGALRRFRAEGGVSLGTAVRSKPKGVKAPPRPKSARPAPAKKASERKLVWIEDVVDDVMSMMDPVARSKSIELSPLPKDATGMVHAKEEDVRLVVGNLLSNALKYTPSGGRVRVGLSETSKEVLFWVQDTGRGIPAKDIPNLFAKFYRSEEELSAARRIPGTGLGLNIAHKAVLAMGGRIWVNSTPGKGSIFYVAIPKGSRS